MDSSGGSKSSSDDLSTARSSNRARHTLYSGASAEYLRDEDGGFSFHALQQYSTEPTRELIEDDEDDASLSTARKFMRRLKNKLTGRNSKPSDDAQPSIYVSEARGSNFPRTESVQSTRSRAKSFREKSSSDSSRDNKFGSRSEANSPARCSPKVERQKQELIDELFSDIGSSSRLLLNHVVPRIQLDKRGMTSESILQLVHVEKLSPFIPSVYLLGKPWVLLYSTQRDGTSLRTLYRKNEGYLGPVLLVIKDFNNQMFGSFCNQNWQIHKQSRYYGTRECFLWKYADDEMLICGATGKNNFFIHATAHYIGMGGGEIDGHGNFGLFINESLCEGSSGPSDTFDNVCLAGDIDFRIATLEIWGL